MINSEAIHSETSITKHYLQLPLPRKGKDFVFETPLMKKRAILGTSDLRGSKSLKDYTYGIFLNRQHAQTLSV